MGLRCLLGHDFGDAEIEREREEEGNEMVVTIREVKTCERCGAERVLSENKEVTSIRTPSEVGLDAASAGDDAGEAGEDRSEEAAETSPGSDAGFGGAGDVADADAEDAPGATAFVENAEEDEPFEPPQSAEEDDGLILEDDSPSGGRSEGRRGQTEPEPDVELDSPSTDVDVTADAIETEEAADDAEFIDAEEAAEADDDGPVPWPEHDDVAVEEPGDPAEHEWPTAAGDDEGFAAEPSDGSPSEITFGGLTPDADGTVADDENGETAVLGSDGPMASAEGAVGIETPAPDAETEYYCPKCETTWPASQSSTRAGDICRECRRGYIAERRL